jgi:hypothetical protein
LPARMAATARSAWVESCEAIRHADTMVDLQLPRPAGG